MTLDQALKSLTPKTFITRKGGPNVRLSLGAELALYHRYLAFDGSYLASFDASAEDLAAKDWETRPLTPEVSESKPKKG